MLIKKTFRINFKKVQISRDNVIKSAQGTGKTRSRNGIIEIKGSRDNECSTVNVTEGHVRIGCP